jgi:hypothetical protein
VIAGMSRSAICHFDMQQFDKVRSLLSTIANDLTAARNQSDTGINARGIAREHERQNPCQVL